jgi:hypothetical protein
VPPLALAPPLALEPPLPLAPALPLAPDVAPPEPDVSPPLPELVPPPPTPELPELPPLFGPAPAPVPELEPLGPHALSRSTKVSEKSAAGRMGSGIFSHSTQRVRIQCAEEYFGARTQ